LIWKEQGYMWIIPWKRNVSEMFLSRLLLYTSKDQKHLSFPTLSISNIFHYTLFGFHIFIHSLVFEFLLFSFLAVKKIETWPVVEQYYYVFFCLKFIILSLLSWVFFFLSHCTTAIYPIRVKCLIKFVFALSEKRVYIKLFSLTLVF
jgi:hypothetical protein